MPTENPDEGLDGLPQFQEATTPPPARTTAPSDAPSTPTSGAQPTTPTRPPSAGAGETGPEKRATTSSPASSEPSPEVDEALEQLGEGIAHLAGLVANKATKRKDDRWLMLPDEAHAIGGALGRIGARQVPAELVDGDGGDLLTIGSVALGYTMRNLAGISADDMERLRLQQGHAPEERPIDVQPMQPQPAPPPQQGPAAPGAHDVDEPATQASPIIAQL